MEVSSSARAADNSFHCAISFFGDDLEQLLLPWLGLEQAAYGGDGGAGHGLANCAGLAGGSRSFSIVTHPIFQCFDLHGRRLGL